MNPHSKGRGGLSGGLIGGFFLLTDYPPGKFQDLNSSAIETALQAVPIGLVAKDLSPWSESEVFRGIVRSALAEVVEDRIDSAMSAATESDDAWAGHIKYLG